MIDYKLTHNLRCDGDMGVVNDNKENTWNG